MFEYIVEIEKYNEHHDPKTGRFTHAPGGAWSIRIASEKSEVMAKNPNEQALYVFENGGETQKKCLAAMRNGKTEELVNNYFKIMEKNGDPTPTKKTSGQLDSKLSGEVAAKYGGDWEKGRLDYIRNITGQNDTEAAKTREEMQRWFGGSWSNADTSTLDKYIEQDHAYDGKLYRGMKFDDDDFESFMKNISPGAEIGMRRNSSWSSDEMVARRFGRVSDDSVNSVYLICEKNRTSAPVAYLAGNGESEVIAHSQAKWTVLHTEIVEQSGGKRNAIITVVEKGA